jgi:hypothetical protein
MISPKLFIKSQKYIYQNVSRKGFEGYLAGFYMYPVALA